ncbi:UDP-N-acetyl-alpha-D-muramoyl-L-alanyl-L-glutamate epimerase [soil metagenome]
MQHSSFIFESFDLDLSNKKVIFRYTIKHDDETISLSEKLILPKAVDRDIPQELLTSIVAQLHLILGISYWKLFCPQHIIVNSTSLTKDQAIFWDRVYTYGLGEFFYRNEIDFRNLINFPANSTTVNPITINTKNRSLVGIGGGKDSIVSIELLKKAQKSITGYSVPKDVSAIIQNTVTIAAIDSLQVTRIMDPAISSLNKRNDTYNGHVPVSSIYAFVGFFLAILYDYQFVISSNEHSANYGNVEYLGNVINHQWSKSLEFEKLFQKYIHDVVTPSVQYFSLLRPWYEIKIAEVFAKYSEYFGSFSSCNRNFSSTMPNATDQKWCGSCPKCAFVFVLLAAFLKKQQLLDIFKENLFEKPSLLPLFKELLGMKGIKPFECVGTSEETKVAFYMAYETGNYENDLAMDMFINECLPEIKDIDELKKSVFMSEDNSSIPEEFRAVIL